MSPSPYRPGEQPPPVPKPNRTPRPIEEPEPEDLPDEKPRPTRTKSVNQQFTLTHHLGNRVWSLSVLPVWAFAINDRHQLM